MNKKEIIKLYLADLNNIVKQSPARDNRITMLEKELDTPEIGERKSAEEILEKRLNKKEKGLMPARLMPARIYDDDYAGASTSYIREDIVLELINASQVEPIGLPSDEEINKKIFALCSEMRPWDGKSNPQTPTEKLIEFANWLRSRNQKGK